MNTATTQTFEADVLSAAPRTTPARFWRTLASKWDFFAVIGLMMSSTAYSVYALVVGS